MILVELKESMYNKAFDLIDEAKHGAKTTKMALCELEDCLENCFEEEDEYAYSEGNTINGDVDVEVGEVSYRRGMRSGMRSGMRDGMHDAWHNDSTYTMRPSMRRGMRRNRMTGRYSY